MAWTKSFKGLVEHHVKGDTKFAEALLREGIDAMLSGDVDTGKTILRDYIKATVGFVARVTPSPILLCQNPNKCMMALGTPPEENPP